MTHKAMILLMSCAVVLAGCYRQADESFQQVDSQSVQSIASPTTAPVIQVPAETTEDVSAPNPTVIAPTTDGNVLPSKTPDPADLDPTIQPLVSPTLGVPVSTDIPAIVPTATNPVFVTPEPPPGQVEQPTILPPTATATFDIIPPTATDIADGPQAGDDCIYEIVSGDNLFRIAIENGTTVEAIQQANSLESDTINVGDLLRIPGCVPGQSNNEDEPDSPVAPTATSSVGGSSIATVEPVDGSNIPTAGQQIHVVVSGETLGGIANRYGTTIAAIVEINTLTDPDALSVGDELVIPARN